MRMASDIRSAIEALAAALVRNGTTVVQAIPSLNYVAEHKLA
jgi:hypothetical protein